MDQLFSSGHSDSLLVVAIAFLIGSIPFHLLSARFFGKSSNKRAQTVDLATAAFDIAKGALAVYLASSGLIHAWVGTTASEADPNLEWAAGFFVVLGHCYRPWTNFRGGKGLATAFGAALVLSPLSALIGLGGYLVTYHAQRATQLANIVAVCLACVGYVALNPIGVHSWIGAVMVFLVLLKQEANLDALLENRDHA